MHLSPASPCRGRWFRVAALVSAALVSLALAGPAEQARANPAGPHDPIGAVWRVTAVAGGIRFTGWAADPDALATNVTVGVVVDGHRWTGAGPTSVARPRITARYRTGPTPGFSITGQLNSDPHTACVVARDVAAGLDTVLTCVPTPLGTRLNDAQRAAHSPQGSIQHAAAHRAAMRFRGWASDPDYLGRNAIVVLYVDGRSAATVVTHRYPAPRPDTAGPRSAYDITVPVATGTHIGCLWVVNVGLGSNTPLGCAARDTRGPAGSGAVTVPRRNKTVASVAKRHVGDPYVWGATGPDKFDCSGLVLFSYGRTGYATPRVSEDQALEARLIPAARAVPGDLVFYHDSVGDVYHVGIYLSPGKTVAAIDTDQGVDYQNIWDPAVTTYGSFTHI